MIRCNIGNKDYFIPGQVLGIFGQRDPMIRYWQARDPKSDVFSEWCWVSASRLFPMWNVSGLADFSGWTTPSSISFCVFFIKKSTKINGVCIVIVLWKFQTLLIESPSVLGWYQIFRQLLFNPISWNLWNPEVLFFGLLQRLKKQIRDRESFTFCQVSSFFFRQVHDRSHTKGKCAQFLSV